MGASATAFPLVIRSKAGIWLFGFSRTWWCCREVSDASSAVDLLLLLVSEKYPAFGFTRLLSASREVSSASAAADLLLFACAKRR
jgi:hypothetical protein